MPRSEFVLSGYRTMWLFVMFDLPVKTKRERKRYADFRKLLVASGFSMLQFSVYARCCASEEIGKRFSSVIQKHLPPAGHVRVLMVTDRQFGKMENYVGRKPQANESAPRQLELF